MSEASLTLKLMQAGVPNLEVLACKGLNELLAVARKHGVVTDPSLEAAGQAAAAEDSEETGGAEEAAEPVYAEDGVPFYEGNRNDNGEWEGQGTYHFADGSVYQGEFSCNQFHGRGTMSYTSGSAYVGDWRAGRKHGSGTYKWADGRIEVGLYEGDESVGEGVMWSADQRQAWKIVNDGREVEEVSLLEARNIATRVGEPVPVRTWRQYGRTV